MGPLPSGKHLVSHQTTPVAFEAANSVLVRRPLSCVTNRLKAQAKKADQPKHAPPNC